MVLGILGAGGLGREILETARLINNKENIYDEIIFVDNNPELSDVQGKKVYLFDDTLIKYKNNIEFILGLGEPNVRLRVIREVLDAGYDFTTIIHPNVHIPDTTTVGKGCYIAPHSFISCNVTIGDYALIQPNVNIGHDCVIGHNVNICGMTTLGGACTIGDNTFIAMGVAVIQGCNIGHDSIIGLGSAVHKDIPDEVIALGNPARVIKQNEDGKVFK